MITLKELQEHFDLHREDIERVTISPVFMTYDGKWAFQKVGGYYRLYKGCDDGSFVEEFNSFKALCVYISKHRQAEPGRHIPGRKENRYD